MEKARTRPFSWLKVLALRIYANQPTRPLITYGLLHDCENRWMVCSCNNGWWLLCWSRWSDADYLWSRCRHVLAAPQLLRPSLRGQLAAAAAGVEWRSRSWRPMAMVSVDTACRIIHYTGKYIS